MLPNDPIGSAVLEAIPDPVLILDTGGRIERMNAAASKLLRLSLSEVNGKAVSEIPATEMTREPAPQIRLKVDGIRRIFSILEIPLRGASGNPLGRVSLWKEQQPLSAYDASRSGLA